MSILSASLQQQHNPDMLKDVAGRRPVAKQGGGRNGYAVATDVLDDDWQDEFEEVADDEEGAAPLPCCYAQLSLFDYQIKQTYVFSWYSC